MTLVLTGLDIEAKAALAERTLWARVPRETYEHVDVQLVRGDRPDPATAAEAQAQLRVTVKDRDPAKVGRAFSNLLVEIGLGTYPGYFPTTMPGDATPYGVYWPTTVPAETVTQHVVVAGQIATLPDPQHHAHPARDHAELVAGRAGPTVADGATLHDHEGEAVAGSLASCDGRSGGWSGRGRGTRAATPTSGSGCPSSSSRPRRDRAYGWLAGWLTPDRVRALLPEAAELEVDVHPLPNLHAVNVVLHGFLGRGVAANDLLDPQAKGLGERLRARVVEVPADLLDAEPGRSTA